MPSRTCADRRRRPEQTPLYQVVQHHLETYLAMAEEGEADPLPAWTEHEFRRYLTCGILAFGFARAWCTHCGQEERGPNGRPAAS